MSHFAVAYSLACLHRVPPPLGQLPPLQDFFISLIRPNSALLGLLFLALFFYSKAFLFLLAALIMFFVVWHRRKTFHFLTHELKLLQDSRRENRNEGKGGMVGCKAEEISLSEDKTFFAPEGVAIHAPLSFPMTLHPYFLMFTDLHPKISIEMVKTSHVEGDLHCDIWRLRDCPAGDAKRRVFFYVHGGGWIGGHSRAVSQLRLLHRLVCHGWLIVSCRYRKERWPQQIEDCWSTFQWLLQNMDELGGDPENIHLCGSSAGGHIVSLLNLRVQEYVKSTAKSCKIASMVLFYPAVDPADDFCDGATFPLSFSALGIQSGQSLLHWFFWAAVLRQNSSQWVTACPVRDLERDSNAAATWPSTLIVHGELDSIVPVEHSIKFLNLLMLTEPPGEPSVDENSTEAWRARRLRDKLIMLPGCKHSFEIGDGPLADLVTDYVLTWL